MTSLKTTVFNNNTNSIVSSIHGGELTGDFKELHSFSIPAATSPLILSTLLMSVKVSDYYPLMTIRSL